MAARGQKDELVPSVDAAPAAGEEQRSSKSRLAALIGGLAIVGAAVGVAGVAMASASEATLGTVSGPTYSAELAGPGDAVGIAAGVRGGGVRGRADLDVDNVLTWNLRKLESHASGTIHINTGRSCDDLGSSLWDAETGPNPWPSVSWTSDSKGKSSGSLDLDEIAGAYSFAANLGHAVVFYSSDEQVLACGVLKPEGDYRKFGVRSELNGGFVVHQDEATAGEVLVSKDNVMTWGMFNLEADQTGVVSVLAGGDCSDPDNTLFTGEWQTNKWGIAQGELALDSAVHDFARVVDRAVAFRSADGAVVACDTLSLFVEKMNEALRAVRQELKDIQSTYESEGSDPTPPTTNEPISETTDAPTSSVTPEPAEVTAVVKELRDIPEICYETGTRTLIDRTLLEQTASYLRSNLDAKNAAIEAAQQNTSTPEQIAFLETYRSKQFLYSQISKSRSRARSYLQRNCYNVDCTDARSLFLSTESSFKNAIRQLDLRKDEFDAALSAVEAGSATPEQEASAASYHKLVTEKETTDASLEELKATILASCPANTWCTFNSERFPSDGCTPFAACNNEKFRLAEQGRKLSAILAELFDKEPEYELAVEADAIGNATEAQQTFLEEYRILQRNKQLAGRSVTQGTSALEANPLCTAPVGTFSLSPDNVLSWELSSLQPQQKGRVVIDTASYCSESALGVQAALEGTAPYDAVFWDTTDSSSSTTATASDSVDLSTITGTLTFEENYPRAVVIYTEDNERISCGTLAVAETTAE